MTSYLFLKSLDVLFFRGNEAFGDAGQHGEALMPPWPSVFSGALRSAILAADPQTELGFFSERTADADVKSEVIRKIIGTPRKPGAFRLRFVTLGTREKVFFPAPADLLVWEDEHGNDRKEIKTVRRLAPVKLSNLTFNGAKNDKLQFSFPSELSYAVVGKLPKGKPSAGWWLTQEGLEAYLRGKTPSPEHFIHSSRLWSEDFRLGIARSRESFTAEEHKIYTTMGIVLAPEVGFVVGVEGVDEDQLLKLKVVRLGGDGRGAEVHRWQGTLPTIHVSSARWFAVCVTPCVSPFGWKPPVGSSGGTTLFPGDTKLVACRVARPQVLSGWDMAAHQPKPAQTVIPQGSVFYFQGSVPNGQPFVAGLEAWLKIEENPKPAEYVWRQRLAEGCNLTLIGEWPENC